MTTDTNRRLHVVPDVRPQVVRLLAITDLGTVLNSPSAVDWKRLDGTTLTVPEAALVASANRQELLAGRRILEQKVEKAKAEGADMERVMELTRRYFDQLGDGATMGDVEKVMPEAERNELIELLARLTPKSTSEALCDLIEEAGQELADNVTSGGWHIPGPERALAERLISGWDDAGHGALFEYLIFDKVDRLIDIDGLLPETDESHNATTEMGAVLMREIRRQDYVDEALQGLVEAAIIRECNYILHRTEKAKQIVEDKIAAGELIRTPGGGLVQPDDPNYTGSIA